MKLTSLMGDYLKENLTINDTKAKPISVKKSSWNVEEKKLSIVYTFENRKHKEFFVLEILKYLREHEVDLEFRSRSNKVAIIIHAYSSQISELEIEASKDVNKIKKDVMYYHAEKQ